MFIRRTQIKSRQNGEPYYTYRLVENERVDGKVKQRTLPRFQYRNHKKYKSLGCIMLCNQTRHQPLGATKAHE